MNKPELESVLKKARIPETPEETRQQFPSRVVAGIRRERESWSSSFSLSRRHAAGTGAPQREFQRWFPRLVWGVATAFCILAAFAVGHWRGRIETGTVLANDRLSSMKLIRETLSMFPNRVRAIVEDEHGINLVLSDKPDVPASAPIYVQISDGKRSSSLVTFSGQEVPIAGQQVTVLADGHGGVILAGQHFVWSDSGRVYADGNLKIKAENLYPVSM